MIKSIAARPRGFVLLPVVLAITLVAAIAYLISRESALQLDMAAGEAQVSEAQTVAETSFEHANWQLQQTNCSGYTDLATTGFGSNNYSAVVTDAAGNPLTAGSPVKISATGTLANGTSRSLARDNVKIYQTATTVILQPDAASGKDTYLYEWKSSWNYGIAADLWVDERFTDSTANGLIEFDLGSIPAQAKVINAALALYQNNPSLAGGAVDAHRITRVWTEGTKSGGNGSPNWTESDTGVSWTNVGGDYDAAVAATTTISASTLDWFNWDITALVDGWVAGKYQNYGLALVAQSFGTAAHFHSSDYSDPTLRPKLTITYACECGQTCGVAITPAKKVYWTDDNAELIQRSDEDGSNVETVISGQFKVRGLDIDTVNGKIYWTSDDFIRRADLDGSNIETLVTTGVEPNVDIKLDVDAGKMYWTQDNGTNEVMRANLDGSNVEIYNTSLNSPMYFTLDVAAGYIYLTDQANGDIARMNLDGSGTTILVNGSNSAMGSAVDPVNGKLYWTGGSANDWIKRANLDGSNEETIVTGLNAPQDIAYDADNDRIYWTDALVNPVIKRANADGSNVETIVTGLTRPRGIVLVNADLVPATGGGGGGSCNGNFRDEFNVRSYSNNDGTLTWGTDWQEVGESDGAQAGDVRVRDDVSNYQLRTKDNDNGGEGVEREADLSGATSATLSYGYRRESLDNSNDYTAVEVSANGTSGPWTELTRHQGGGTDSSYQSASHDIGAWISANTRIRFKTSSNMGGSDIVWFDDVEIQCSP